MPKPVLFVARVIIAIAVSGVFCSGINAEGYFGTVLFPVGRVSAAHDARGGEVVGWLGGSPLHAAYWSQSTNGVVDLNPVGSYSSQATAVFNGRQVGNSQGTDGYAHAFIWSGTAASGVDLHPQSMFTSSIAWAMDSVQQAGWGYLPGSETHAVVWSGTANSAVDLHPAGSSSSEAWGVGDGYQVGYAMYAQRQHAMVWSGNSTSAIDLHPAGFTNSIAIGIGTGQQVGHGSKGDGIIRALLWSGSASSSVDLSPSNWIYSEATDARGGMQVGRGQPAPGAVHALLWYGTAGSMVDLNTLLPPTLVSSKACSIDEWGNIFGVAWDAQSNAYSVKWSVIPEPCQLFYLLMPAAFRRRVWR